MTTTTTITTVIIVAVIIIIVMTTTITTTTKYAKIFLYEQRERGETDRHADRHWSWVFHTSIHKKCYYRRVLLTCTYHQYSMMRDHS